MGSRTGGIKARRSIICETALNAQAPFTYAGAARGVVVDRRSGFEVGDSG